MDDIALAIVDPSGNKWAQLLSETRPVRDLILALVTRLDLPKEINYHLIVSDTGRPLDESKNLRESGVQAGDELLLKPIRDQLFIRLLEKIYDQVEDHIKDRMWELAKEELNTLLRLDPNYPDPRGLKQAVRERITPTSDTLRVEEPARGGKRQPSREQPRRGSRCSCITIGVIAGVVGLGVIVLVVALVIGALDISLDDFGGNPTEVVLGTGDVQITLGWENDADIDLHVIDPIGEEIWFEHQLSESGGELDVDANAGCQALMSTPVENIFWPTGGAPRGEYQVFVEYYEECNSSGPTDYQVTIRLDGQIIDIINGTLYEEQEQQFISSFTR